MIRMVHTPAPRNPTWGYTQTWGVISVILQQTAESQDSRLISWTPLGPIRPWGLGSAESLRRSAQPTFKYDRARHLMVSGVTRKFPLSLILNLIWGVLASPMRMLDRSPLALRGVAALPSVRAIVLIVWWQF